jgi:hypothetical protein
MRKPNSSSHLRMGFVLSGFALGAVTGYYAHSRENPLILGVLPKRFVVGLHKQF